MHPRYSEHSMLRHIPNWVLWAIVIAAAITSPFVAMLSLFLVGELLWAAANTIGIPASLGLCGAASIALLLLKLRPEAAEPEAG
jgi:hypothetical protein